jgi:hypothetical protein
VVLILAVFEDPVLFGKGISAADGFQLHMLHVAVTLSMHPSRSPFDSALSRIDFCDVLFGIFSSVKV